MNGKQFIRSARKWAKSKQLGLTVESVRGKGGHQIVRLSNGAWTTVKSGEIGSGLFAAMLNQLGARKEDF